MQPTPWTRTDRFLVGAVVLVSWFHLARSVNLHALPFEDAVMLWRYARHLAEGHGLVWNVGEPPVDGATDFLFTVVLGGMAKMGVGVPVACHAVNVTSHVVTAALAYVASRVFGGAPRWAAFGAAAWLATTDVARYVNHQFGTPFAALLVAVVWSCALAVAARPESRRRAVTLAVACIVMSMNRPEYCFVAAFVAVALAVRLGRAALPALVALGAAFATLGVGYLLWRRAYFGYTLPNPYYLKGAFELHWQSLRTSAATILEGVSPFVFVLLGGLFVRATRRTSVFALVPTILFATLWILMSDETNAFGRFQYPIFPIPVMSGAALIGAFEADGTALTLVATRAARWGLSTAAVLAVILRSSVVNEPEATRDGLHDIGHKLRPYADRGYVLGTTEAGHLPYWSEWRAVDLWGLNDQWIAHRGLVTEEYLDRSRPHVLMFHAYSTPLTEDADRSPPHWKAMLAVLRAYVARHDYVLAAVYGPTPYEAHYWYVRRDFPDSAAIVDAIRRTPYGWGDGDDDRPCVDFARVRSAPADASDAPKLVP